MCVCECVTQQGAWVNQRALVGCHFCIKKHPHLLASRGLAHTETHTHKCFRLQTRSPEHKIRSSSKKFTHYFPSVLPLHLGNARGYHDTQACHKHALTCFNVFRCMGLSPTGTSVPPVLGKLKYLPADWVFVPCLQYFNVSLLGFQIKSFDFPHFHTSNFLF